MNQTQLKATQILNMALTILWDGQTDQSGREKYGCYAVFQAAATLVGSRGWYKVVDMPVVVSVTARISKYIGGYTTAYGYLSRGLGKTNISDAELQAFRKKMLEDILAEFEKKGLLERQIEVLEQVKELRTSGKYHHNFVCWNVDAVQNQRVTPEGAKIKDDIDTYIGGFWTLRSMMEERDGIEYEQDDPRVAAARMEMIEVLLARYKAQLEAV